jgi:hypothetical protein
MTKNQVSTLRPGLLVAIKTSIVGNVSYATRDIERDHVEGEARIAKWETERKIADAAEHEKAVKVRSSATHTIKRLCATTAFGCLCPEERADDLMEAVAEARVLVDAFNAEARITRIRIYVIAGRVAPDDVEAVRAIRAELAAVMADMQRGVQALSPGEIREAATRAKQLAEMLTDASKKRVEVAVEAARATATAINKAVKAGEQAALQVDEVVVKKLAAARTSFLDIDNVDAQEIAQPQPKSRSLDLEAAPAGV